MQWKIMSDIENRVMELEIKNSHQEDSIEQLNDIVFQQQKNIDEMARHLEQVLKKINNLSDANSKEEPEPPPPHY
ncbi:MAG: SlyX family protein [Bacteroidota bacterium]